MKYKELIKGVRIPAVNVGTWGMGGKDTADYSNNVESRIAICTARPLGNNNQLVKIK